MIIPMLVIGVLFFITWIVIGVSGAETGSSCCHKPHDMYSDPFHKCEITELRYQNETLKATNYRLESKLRQLEMQRRDWDFPSLCKNPQELFEELVGVKRPADIKIENATVTITQKAKKK